jgi:uncharacterized membrane protein YoaK (UPF0700 family)
VRCRRHKVRRGTTEVLIQIKPPRARVASREETLLIATMLAFVGGYLDAYTWIMHCVFAVICIAFGVGAALGALITKGVLGFSLAIPVVVLIAILLRCELSTSATKDELRRSV